MILNKNPDILIAGGSFGAANGKTLLESHPRRTGHLLSSREEEYQASKRADGHTIFNVAPLFQKQIIEEEKIFTVKDCDLPPNLICSHRSEVASMGEAKERGLLILAYPAQVTREALLYLLSQSKGFLENRDILLVSKGIEKGTLKTPCQITEEVLAECGLLTKETRKKICYLIGPNLAWELMRGDLMIANMAGDPKAVKRIAKFYEGTNMTIRQTRGRFGLELAGATKNALAIGAGILKGLDMQGYHMGDSTRASFAAICTTEEKRLIYAADRAAAKFLATQYGAEGDSMLAYISGQTRNFKAGVTLVDKYGEYSKGKSLSELRGGQLIEGEETALPLLQFAASMNVKMPVLSVIARVLKRELNPHQAVGKIREISNSWAAKQGQSKFTQFFDRLKEYLKDA